MTGAFLLLEDGTRFDGEAVGAGGRGVYATGEVVFNTAMSGYQESVTDPSYRGQIIVFTYPLVGNYGVSAQAMESDSVHTRAVVMRETPSIWRWRSTVSARAEKMRGRRVASWSTRAFFSTARESVPESRVEPSATRMGRPRK